MKFLEGYTKKFHGSISLKLGKDKFRSLVYPLVAPSPEEIDVEKPIEIHTELKDWKRYTPTIEVMYLKLEHNSTEHVFVDMIEFDPDHSKFRKKATYCSSKQYSRLDSNVWVTFIYC